MRGRRSLPPPVIHCSTAAISTYHGRPAAAAPALSTSAVTAFAVTTSAASARAVTVLPQPSMEQPLSLHPLTPWASCCRRSCHSRMSLSLRSLVSRASCHGHTYVDPTVAACTVAFSHGRFCCSRSRSAVACEAVLMWPFRGRSCRVRSCGSRLCCGRYCRVHLHGSKLF